MTQHEATLNLDDGWIRFWPDYRLNQDEYDAVRKAGLSWRRSEQCFFGPWNPRLEDWLRDTYGLELLPDDTDLLTVAEERAAHYQQYSDNAQQRADDAYQASKDATAGIPLGQPILVGHHSERRHRNAIKRAQSNATKSYQEAKKAQKWESRAKDTIRHAAQRYTPLKLKRRIEKLEAKQRVYQTELDRYTTYNKIEQSNNADEAQLAQVRQHLGLAADPELRKRNQQWDTRWYDFITKRLEVARALYEESGGLPADNLDQKPQKGGGLSSIRYPNTWYQIKRVNKKTITATGWLGIEHWPWKFPHHEVNALMSPEEWKATPKVLTSVGYKLVTPKEDNHENSN